MPIIKTGRIAEKRLARKMQDYLPLVPPFDKPPIEFTAKEAKFYFDWYMEHLEERCQYLVGKASKGIGYSSGSFDYSPESLILIWRWFLKDAEVVYEDRHWLDPDQSDSIEEADRKKFLRELMYHKGRNEFVLSPYSEFVLRDIGMYLGQVFIHNYPDVLKWVYKRTPKRYIHVNEPLINGFVSLNDIWGKPLKKPFIGDYEPIHMAGVQAVRLLVHTELETDLLTSYKYFAEYADTARELLQQKQTSDDRNP